MNINSITANIKRIRWTGNSTTRTYLVSAALTLNDKDTAFAYCDQPVPAERNWCDLTESGRQIVNDLLVQSAVQHLNVSCFSLEVTIRPAFTWDDLQAWILAVINTHLFQGEADIGELGKTSCEHGVIRYKGTKKDTVRWYGVSMPLRPDEKCRTSLQVTSWATIESMNKAYLADASVHLAKKQMVFSHSVSALGGETKSTPRNPAANEPSSSHLSVTAACLSILKEVYSLRGVMSIWVGAFEISVEIAPVFSWSDYHQVVVDIINKHLFDGKAAVEFDG